MKLRLVLAGLLVISAGCSAMQKMGIAKAKETDINASEMSAPARETAQKQTAGGTIDKVTKENERKRDVYDVEATVNGEHREYLIAADNGELLGTEVPVPYSEVPAPVRAAAEKHFGTSSGLTAMKGQEFGETHYEIEGMTNGKKHEASFKADGSPEK